MPPNQKESTAYLLQIGALMHLRHENGIQTHNLGVLKHNLVNV